jgi:hypothetical protein
MVDVVVLAVSSLRSDPILRRKWRRLREMHTYSAPMTPPSRSSEIWWSGRWDRQHDSVVSMVESMRRQGFACLRGGRRTEKEGFRKRAAASQRTRSKTSPPAPWSFYRKPNLQQGLGLACETTSCKPRHQAAARDRSLSICACVLLALASRGWPIRLRSPPGPGLLPSSKAARPLSAPWPLEQGWAPPIDSVRARDFPWPPLLPLFSVK